MRILIVNIKLSGRSGTEVVVRDLALGLLRRNHRPMVYAPWLGDAATELRTHGIVVVDDPAHLPETPDLIHAHHNAPLMRVLDRYPHCPVIWMCHDSRNWWDQPPSARIHRYVAIDRTRRDYLTRVMVPDDRVDVLYNAVDLGRIPLRPGALPARPRRALAYTKTRGQIGVL